MERADLELVEALARTGSVTAAAAELGVAQPAASRRLSQLERALGATLFARGRTGAVPTTVGALLADRATDLLARWGDLQRDVDLAIGGQLGRLRIGALPTLGSDVLPPALAEIRRVHPAVRLELHTSGDPLALLDGVRRGALDVAVVALPDALPPGLRIALRGAQRFVVALPADHPLARHGMVQRAALVDEPAVSLPRGEGLRTVLDSVFADLGHGSRRPTIAIETAERELLLPFVTAGLGYAVVPQVFAEQRAGTGVAIRPLRPRLERSVGAVVRRGEPGALVTSCLGILATLSW